MPRNKTQLIVSLLLGAAVCFLPPALTAAQEDAGGEKRLSQPIQKAEAKTLQDISRRLEEIQENLPELLVQAREKIQGLSPRLNQLLRLKAFVGKDFRKISLIRHALQNLQKQLANSLEPIQSLDRELEDLRSSLETSKES
ncbi:MAG: hypothetical protein K9K64_16815, partial [Desulfohalobiaceae bacterium]|nr:hypothetical protein [Desulfohalobiaceae bacterium]